MKSSATTEQIEKVENRLIRLGFKTHPIHGEKSTVIGAIGDKTVLSQESIINMDGVETIMPITKPYKLISRELVKGNTTVTVGNVLVGGDEIILFAGPCAVESEEQYITSALKVKEAGGHILRGGAFKPRTSPYAFQGLEEAGLKIMAQAREITGLPFVTEVVDTRDVELVAKYADMIQIGARNMQNFRLLTEVGKTKKPVLLKRGLAATIEEWLMSAEYIIAEGNADIILCERGIRTYETTTRNTLDISAIPVIKELTHLPIVVDPSHATGKRQWIPALSNASIAAGADGLIIEVHHNPCEALCDGPQSLDPEQFRSVVKALKPIAAAVGRKL